MAQLSRPFQIALGALALFVLVWFVGLHRPGSTSTNSSASSSPPRSVAAHTAVHPGSRAHTTVSSAHAVRVTHGRVTHGHATVHVTSAHAGATQHSTTSVGTRTSHTHTSVSVQRHSVTRAAAHTPPAAAHTSPAAARTSPATAHTSPAAAHTLAPATQTASTGASHKAAVDPRRTPSAQRGPAAAATSPATPARQAAVAAELKQGKVVLILFWNSHSSADAAVHSQVLAAAHKLGRTVVVQSATANQVGDFGSITRDIQVYQTPTLLVVNPHGQVTTVTGYTDAYAIEQTVREARG